MKQKIYIIGLLTLVLVFLGAIFKISHFPGAGLIMTTGIITMILVFLPLALTDLNKSLGNPDMRSLYIVTYITCLLVFTAMLFKIQHWLFAGLLLTIALPFPYVVFLPVFLKVTSRDSNFSVYNTVFVLLLLVVNSVLSGLLSLNVSREKIFESYNISRDYVRQENVLLQLPASEKAGKINQKIDELLTMANEYQGILLKYEGKTLGDWKHHPENLSRPDAVGLAHYLLTVSGEPADRLRLEKGLQELSELLSKDRSYSEIEAAAPALFDLRHSQNEDNWGVKVFNDNSLAWALMYLDGLKSDLLIIRALNH